MDDFVLTIDTDWAKEREIDFARDILMKKKVKSTWFITHDSPSIRTLPFEIGLHPNFDTDSTQGRTPPEVLEHLLKIRPSKIIRTHKLIQSTPHLSVMVDFGFEIDASLFLSGVENITPHTFYLPKPLVRVPHFWEDDMEMMNPNKSWDITHPKYHRKGLKVFTFHPIHIYGHKDVRRFFNQLVDFLSGRETYTISEIVKKWMSE